jgi:hypothetical protein
MIETWKEIPNCDGFYEASNLGNIRSYKNGKWGKKTKPHILKQSVDSKNYKSVNLNGKTINVHKLIAITFLNYIPDNTHNIVVDHINNIKTDNRLENLQLISNRENCSKDRINNITLTGITFDKRKNKYQARIIINNKKIHLGLFNDKYIAYIFYKLAINNINLYNGNNDDFRKLIRSIYE